MARVVILGAGISGHTVARYLGRWLKGSEHQISVVSPKAMWNWIPSNIWVGVGEMTKKQVTFELDPVYRKLGVDFRQAKAVSVHPDGGDGQAKPYVTIEYTDESRAGQTDKLEYDYLVNATGPKLNFGATPGLGPEGGHTVSVCTPDHAIEANEQLQENIAAMKRGETRNFVVGTGHGMCTCQGAAFEYIYNIDHALRQNGVRDKARIMWISNEYELGDFGMGGVHIQRGGYMTNGKVFAESLMVERNMEWITRAHVTKVEPGKIHYETLDGTEAELDFDFAMLIPPFAGVGLKAYGQDGSDITDKLFAANGMMKVDADYTPRPYEEWSKADWPSTYQNPSYKNIFSVGIAFAPPHPISKVMKSPKGTQISPTPPRTGMPSAAMGRAVAASIRDMVNGAPEPTHRASMGETGAACVASTGSDIFKGTAATMTVYPVVPDYEKYPEYGRDMDLTFGEIGLAGHWMKYILHHVFIYQAKLGPGWHLLPD
ncbi:MULTISPECIES: NAD(P)/FAD-dependent oxidoreductase [Thiorhodovibrio]|uniref:NAD(P)/FAD-dependent oxidoreductase n=1 Tax=Thiorhodovibrio TaxID=61593 RepID=UPI00191480BF|nr:MULTISPECIES: FAD-dependent oxidoreductase [Thiorhodovibrio]MBK5967448.1 sulfide:quinone reductase [Thiorhodovibrio winogradskyi]WPL12574.1 sulfide:quinone oxidoreductase [Thiorhodovibrio litoralis]